MKLERISLQLRDRSMRAFDFHSGLTVVEALPGEEHALARALVGALTSAGDGVHVEFTRDDGAALVAFRPFGAPHRVIDVETATDVTSTYARPDGGVDVLAPRRSVHPAVEREMVAGPNDLLDGDPTEAWVAELSKRPPSEVLAVAQAEASAEQDLRRATAAARATPEDATRVQPVEATREMTDTGERRHARFRIATVVAGCTIPVATVVGLNSVGMPGTLGLIGGTAALTGGCLFYERKLSRSVGAQNAAPSEHEGVPDFFGERPVASPRANPDVRTNLLAAAERYHLSAMAWQNLAGNIPAPWVLAQADRIRRVAELRASASSTATEPERPGPAPRSARLLAGLYSRVTGRASDSSQEKMPVVLEEPLVGLNWSEKAPVLEFLGRLASQQQLIVVTSDPEVLSWAKLEAMTATIGVIAAGESEEPSDNREGVAPTAEPTRPDGRGPSNGQAAASSGGAVAG